MEIDAVTKVSRPAPVAPKEGVAMIQSQDQVTLSGDAQKIEMWTQMVQAMPDVREGAFSDGVQLTPHILSTVASKTLDAILSLTEAEAKSS